MDKLIIVISSKNGLVDTSLTMSAPKDSPLYFVCLEFNKHIPKILEQAKAQFQKHNSLKTKLH